MNAEQLRNIDVLHALDPDALERLAAVLEEKTYSDGQSIFAEGDPGDSMHFLVEGRVRIEKRAQADGDRHKTLAILEPGDYFGEMALIDQKPRSAAGLAIGPAKTLRLSKVAFDEIQRRHSVVGLSVLFAMISTSNQRIRRLSTQLVVYDEVGKAIGEADNLQTLLDAILQQLLNATGADWGLFLLRAQFAETMELRSQAGLTLTSHQREAVTAGQGFLGVVLQSPEERIVASFDDEEPFKSSPRMGFETASLLLSPIVHAGQLLGIVILGDSERAHFDLDALNLCKGIARQAAQAILNARHREEQEARSRHSRQFVRF